MDAKEQTHPEQSTQPRQAYEPPQVRMVELLPEETLGIGCKTNTEISCATGFNFGS